MASSEANSVYARATDEAPFSNSTEGESWFAAWCATCARDAFADQGKGCPLLTVAMCGRTPAEWLRAPNHEVFTDFGMAVPKLYQCIEYRPRGGGTGPARPLPEPDQDGLFDRPSRTTRLLLQPAPSEVPT